ncbi:hypothetical protein CAEBREN_25313 [Caenorhabditis brenneri]|uniref:Uncharacterized protein n=1 Tax=Caenorhabditis brenneri TaxID=135651 RepID=G0PA62_CAEBE|nr:hypothetical protein CAEBREN_25313 [Caenorhabditis brenneri]
MTDPSARENYLDASSAMIITPMLSEVFLESNNGTDRHGYSFDGDLNGEGTEDGAGGDKEECDTDDDEIENDGDEMADGSEENTDLDSEEPSSVHNLETRYEMRERQNDNYFGMTQEDRMELDKMIDDLLEERAPESGFGSARKQELCSIERRFLSCPKTTTKRRIRFHLKNKHRRDGRKLEFYMVTAGEEVVVEDKKLEEICESVGEEDRGEDEKKEKDEEEESGEEQVEDELEESESDREESGEESDDESGGSKVDDEVHDCESEEGDGTEPALDKNVFAKLCGDTLAKITKGKREIEREAVNGLQEAAEAMLVELFEDSQEIALLGVNPSGVVEPQHIRTVLELTEGKEEEKGSAPKCFMCKNCK